MSTPTAPETRWTLPRGAVAWLGLLFALAVGAVLFTRFSIDDRLSRDESIFAYGAQQFIKGVPYYKSVFDAKGPLAPMIGGIGVEAAKIFGANDLHGIRIVFLLCAIAAVGGVYLLARSLWDSVLAGVAAAAALASFKGFAFDAIGGPDAKTPGVAFAVFAMLLLVRRRWFWGAVLGTCAFLCWQPFGGYMVVAVVAAFLMTDASERTQAVVRAVAGVVATLVAIFVYFAIAGGLHQFIEGAFRFPLSGVQRSKETLGQRLTLISHVVQQWYDALNGWLLWGGLLVLGAAVALAVWRGRRAWRELAAQPLLGVVFLSALPIIAFTLSDFQGYPDVYPLLAYGALGAGALVALVRAAPARAVVALAALVLAAFMGREFARFHGDNPSLKVQRARARTIERVLGPGGRLYAIGDPTTLVLTHRRNPDRYIYIGSGVLRWMLHHTKGGLNGWLARIRASDPGVIVVHTWSPRGRKQLAFFQSLSQGYDTRWLGGWQLLVKHDLLQRAQAAGIVLGTQAPKGAASG